MPQWNKVEACVMAHAYDASAQVLLTKESGVQGHPSWVYKMGLQKKKARKELELMT